MTEAAALNTIVVAMDFSTSAARAFAVGIALAKPFGAHCPVLTVREK